MVKGTRCDDCGEVIQPVATSVNRRGPTSGKQYSTGKPAETSITLKLACDCQMYDAKMTEGLGVVRFKGHLPDDWATDDKELDGTEYSR